MRRIRLLSAVVVVGVNLFGCDSEIARSPGGSGGAGGGAGVVPPGSASMPTPNDHDKPGYTLTFLDEFDGVPEYDPSRGQMDLYFDRSKWVPGFIPVAFGQDNGGDGSHYLAGNGEQQTYLSKDFAGDGLPPEMRINPFYFGNSILEIESGYVPDALQPHYWIGNERVFYSGILTTATKFSQQYGLFEARIKMHAGIGAWPAFWLLPQPDTLADNHWPPELDALEQFPMLHPTQSHWGGIMPNGGYGDWAAMPASANVSDDWHVYSIEWTPDTITYRIDDVDIGSHANFVNEPMYLLINVAIGGSWYAGESGHSGDLEALVNTYRADTTQMPYRTAFDWVRVYRKD